MVVIVLASQRIAKNMEIHMDLWIICARSIRIKTSEKRQILKRSSVEFWRMKNGLLGRHYIYMYMYTHMFRGYIGFYRDYRVYNCI